MPAAPPSPDPRALPLLQRGAVEIRGAGAVAVKLTVVEELPTSWTTSSITPSTSFSVPPTLLPLLAGSNGHGGWATCRGRACVSSLSFP